MLCGDIELPEDTMNECSGAITIRNSIVHKGRMKVNSREAEEKYIAIEKMIQYISQIT